MPPFMGPYTLAYARRLRRRQYRKGSGRIAKAAPIILSRMSRRANRAKFRAIPPEVKFFDTQLDFAFDTTLEVPATGQLALIPQGDTQSTRDGRLARITSLQIRGFAYGPSTGGLTPLCYFWIVQDTQANGAAAAASDVFTTTFASTAMINLNNSGRFRILHKETIAPARVGAYALSTSAGIYRSSFPELE